MSMFVSKDPQMLNVLSLVENVAHSRATILLTGESGVGKEQLSKCIHSISNRAKGPFVAVNCAALPENLLESELFGFEKGAFTGATHNKPGKIEIAQGGTFLLDEISELPLALQGKLLRVIQEREIERLGGCSSKKVDVRFICTTNKDLKDLVAKGEFRKDLYYRINVVPVRIPSLKERLKDIEFYSQLFVQKTCEDNGLDTKRIADSALKKLKSWSWPGNVRELSNVIERSILMCQESEIIADHILIDGYDANRAESFGPGMTVMEAEKLLIMKTLDYTQQNKTQAARLLGISIRTLRNKLNEYKKEVSNESNF